MQIMDLMKDWDLEYIKRSRNGVKRQRGLTATSPKEGHGFNSTQKDAYLPRELGACTINP